jgi:hypothetical protein
LNNDLIIIRAEMGVAVKPKLIFQVFGHMCIGWVAKGILDPAPPCNCAPCVCSSGATMPAPDSPACPPAAAEIYRKAQPAHQMAPTPPPPTRTSSSGRAAATWEPLLPLPAGGGSGAEAQFAAARAKLRRCINEKSVSLDDFECVANPPPRVVGGMLHMIPKMDPEMMATELANSSPNSVSESLPYSYFRSLGPLGTCQPA